MTRLLLSALLFTVVCASAIAQNVPLQFGDGYTYISWDNTKKTITLFHEDPVKRSPFPFAIIELPKGHTADLNVPRVGKNSFIVRQESGDTEAIFSKSSSSPFVQITLPLSENMFKEGPVKNIELPKIELQLPAEKLMTLGTAGLRAVDKHKGSYMFLAAADPETRSGVVTGWITSNKGSGIVFSEKNASGNAVIKPVLEYGKLLPPKDFRSPKEIF